MCDIGFSVTRLRTVRFEARIKELVENVPDLAVLVERRAAHPARALDRAAADFCFTNWLAAAPWPRRSEVGGQLRQHRIAKSMGMVTVSAVFSLWDFRLARWWTLSISGWQPSGAAAPGDFFFMARACDGRGV
jgi:hypothetical protein